MLNQLGVAPTLRGTGLAHAPTPLIQMDWHGGTVSRKTANKKMSELVEYNPPPTRHNIVHFGGG